MKSPKLALRLRSTACCMCRKTLTRNTARPRPSTIAARHVSTAARRENAVASPPVVIANETPALTEDLLKRARVVPASPSYFTARPKLTDSLLSLQALKRKYELLPTVLPGQQSRITWKNATQFQLVIGEPVKDSKYARALKILKRLSKIDPALMPTEITEVLRLYAKNLDAERDRPNPIIIDELGRAQGIGRRKSAWAFAYVVEGEGEVLVNDKPLTQMFGRIHNRESVIWPLKATQRIDKYNVWAIVKGGGVTGQAEALTLAIAKGLMAHEPALKPALRKAGCVARDRRRVERKKPGHLKARKKPTWVKR